MNLKRFSSPEEFLKTVEHKLLENEAVNNLPIGILYGLKRRPDVDAVLLTAENGEFDE
ncbi:MULTISPECIES: hypothetical protein [Bacillus]|uniref:hypothetical protein n=1 Tax=Bacillus TaxID=1386 RepID=UPI000814E4E1|nr:MULTISPECIES: hypothetical protein [Bacillus]MBU8786577.1 hypothetical protein [Bacillus glycinifermentans]MDU0070542.1 hypothetical protein [Bacillus sp. IG6]MED8018406.1 hypothetical protein [Bacillus glycinifermentans]WKB78047.1 hypothetical protein QYM22_04000 [Bacillus glycinifermentans]SCA84518.1 hypothetical protein BGLY_0695 [Bacillus glycinifermentans]